MAAAAAAGAGAGAGAVKVSFSQGKLPPGAFEIEGGVTDGFDFYPSSLTTIPGDPEKLKKFLLFCWEFFQMIPLMVLSRDDNGFWLFTSSGLYTLEFSATGLPENGNRTIHFSLREFDESLDKDFIDTGFMKMVKMYIDSAVSVQSDDGVVALKIIFDGRVVPIYSLVLVDETTDVDLISLIRDTDGNGQTFAYSFFHSELTSKEDMDSADKNSHYWFGLGSGR